MENLEGENNMDEDMSFNDVRERLNSLCWWLVNEDDEEIVDSANEVLFIENGERSYFEYGDYRYLVLEEDELDELLNNELVDHIVKYGECVRDYSAVFQSLSHQAQDEFVKMYNRASPMMQLYLLDTLNVDYFQLYDELKSEWDCTELTEEILGCKEVDIDLENDYGIIRFFKNADFFKEGE